MYNSIQATNVKLCDIRNFIGDERNTRTKNVNQYDFRINQFFLGRSKDDVLLDPIITSKKKRVQAFSIKPQ